MAYIEYAAGPYATIERHAVQWLAIRRGWKTGGKSIEEALGKE